MIFPLVKTSYFNYWKLIVRINIVIFTVLFNYPAFADMDKVKIVTTISPISSIIAMLVKEQAFITSIANNNECPHHYHLKPSDLKKVKDADIVFYIDEEFDGFAGKLMNNHSENVVKISNFTGLNIITNNSQHNWHIWLDLNNVKIILEQISEILAEQFPSISEDIHHNLAIAKKQLVDLSKIKAEKLSNLTDVILLNDSSEYFFDNNSYKIAKLYNSDQKSLKYIKNLQILLNNSNSKCLILSPEQDSRLYDSFKATIVFIESENWQIVKITDRLFYNQYLKIINQVTKCLNY